VTWFAKSDGDRSSATTAHTAMTADPAEVPAPFGRREFRTARCPSPRRSTGQGVVFGECGGPPLATTRR
jgi:hypothetical protein